MTTDGDYKLMIVLFKLFFLFKTEKEWNVRTHIQGNINLSFHNFQSTAQWLFVHNPAHKILLHR